MLTAMEDFVFDSKWPKKIWKPLIKQIVIGDHRPLVMRPLSISATPHLQRLGLYLHVPFCRNLCPYCPYNRIEFDAEVYAQFERAAHREIDLYGALLQNSQNSAPQIISIYIGGGTPTVDPHGLARLVQHLKETFGKPGSICVELHPAAMDDACLGVLREIGVDMLSIGVESLCDRLLEMIGRSHDAAVAADAVQRARAMGFDAVNVDLMFALPGQTLADLDHDLQHCLELGVDQISTYPIFGFPYSELGQKLKIDRIKRPHGGLIRRMLSLIRRRCVDQGLQQCAVWSFLKPRKKKFSSITRHHYLGIGPSAASMTGNHFYLNTFSVAEYAARIDQGSLPIALAMEMDRRLEMAYWLYWRVYEMKIPYADFRELFGLELDVVYGKPLGLLKSLKMLRRDEEGYHITAAAAYWIHRLQNEYSLNYINRLWGTCRRDPWPREVRL